MMRSKVLFVVVLTAMLVLSSVVFAQDATPTLPAEGEAPPADVEPEGPTLESVTADTAAYLGQEVTLEGVVTEFLNVRTFVLGEGAALDDDKVLVINNSPDEYPMHLVVGERVQVTGVVMSSYEDGGLEQVLNNFMGSMTVPQPADVQPPAEATPMTEDAGDAEATPELEEAEGGDDAAQATPVTEVGEEDAEATPELEEAESGDDAAQATPVTEAGEEDAEATPEVEGAEGAGDTEATPEVEATEETSDMAEPTAEDEAGEAPAEPTPEMEPTAEMPESPEPGAEPVTHDFVPLTDLIVERYGNFTILEVTSVMAITVVPEAEEG